jgi:HK97 gp10 family phage protein
MSGFKIQLDGLDEVLKRLDISHVRDEVKRELVTFGKNVEKTAKDLAPVDEGYLKSKIYHEVTDEGNKINVEVGCNADYAAYVEFGTRKYAAAYVATLPPDWRAFAAQYKGKGSGGSFNDFVMAIMAWVERKGIGSLKTKSGNKSKSAASYDAMQQAAYWIALNIIRNGIKPHPFLYPAVRDNSKLLIDRLRQLLNA